MAIVEVECKGGGQAGVATRDGDFINEDTVEQKRNAVGESEGEIEQRSGLRIEFAQGN